jgi:enterochelin esterase-like enzyme
LLQRHRREVTLRISAGGHDREYWKRHLDEYLRLYADALARCQ